jgi:mono/diheme cytochrome c family protein
MLGNFAIWFVVALVAVGFALLTRRVWRAKRWFIKWPGVILSGLLTLILGLVSIVILVGLVQFYMPVGNPPQNLKVAATTDQLKRGEHVAGAFCASCHSANGELPLSGGRDFGPEIPIPLGSFVPPNLTPGGPLKTWSDGEILRAIREGVDRNGQRLFLMSGNNARFLSDEDLQAVIAFLRTQPAVDNKTMEPPDKPTLLFAAFLTMGMLPPPKPAVTAPIVAPTKAATIEYGKYILSYQDCRDCHGENLKGGTPGQLAPVGPNLQVVKGWTQDQFIKTLRMGVDPSGHQISPQMPWQQVGRLDDDELGAVYKYLSSLP